jgi:hypothetical protein
MLPEALDNDFFSGRKTRLLHFCVNDTARVTSGPYSGRVGAVVALDRTRNEPMFLVEFGDGTDELFPQSVLEHVADAV